MSFSKTYHKYSTNSPVGLESLPNPLHPQDFFQALGREHLFSELQKSSIAPALLVQAVEIAPDVEIDPVTKEVLGTPLDDALGQRFTRFGSQPKPNEDGVIFRNEDGSVWQVKRGFGLQNDNGRTGKYLAPKGIGNAIYLPPIPPEVFQRICARNGLDPAAVASEIADLFGGSFWAWVKFHRSLPIVVTEGGKKALSALSQGHMAIALYGCTCGQSPHLTPYLEGREVIAAFDQDSKPSAIEAVKKGLGILYAHVSSVGGLMRVATWGPERGKGLDDLIYNCGAESFAEAVTEAEDYRLIKARQDEDYRLGKYGQDALDLRAFEVESLDEIPPEIFGDRGLYVLSAVMGAGKSQLLRRAIAHLDGVISLTHRVAIGRGLARALGLDYLDDCDRAPRREGTLYLAGGGPTRRLQLCYDSLTKIDPNAFSPGSFDLILDEADQGFSHLLKGATCGQLGIRSELYARFCYLVRSARRVFVASATVSAHDIKLSEEIRGEAATPFAFPHQRNAYEATLYRGNKDYLNAWRLESEARMELGLNLHAATDSKRESKVIYELALTYYPEESVLLVNQDTADAPLVRSFLDSENKAEWLKENGIQVLITSPTVSSSCSLVGWADAVLGLFLGKSIGVDDAVQMLGRERCPVPRIVYAPSKGLGDGIGSTYKWGYRDRYLRQRHLLSQGTGRNFDPLDDPRLDYISASGARHNRAMLGFGFYLQTALEAQGHGVVVEPVAYSEAELEGMGRKWRALQERVDERERQAIREAPIISPEEAEALEDKTHLSPEDALKLRRFKLCDFYAIVPKTLTTDDVKADRKGKTSLRVGRLENLLYQGLAEAKDLKRLDFLTGQSHAPVNADLPRNLLQTRVAEVIGLEGLLLFCRDHQWHDDTPYIKELGEKARQCSQDIKTTFGFRISAKMSNCQIIGQFLDALGLKSRRVKSERVAGGKRRNLYGLDEEHLEWLKALLERRFESAKIEAEPSGSPLCQWLLSGVIQAEDGEDFPPQNSAPPPHSDGKTGEQEADRLETA